VAFLVAQAGHNTRDGKAITHDTAAVDRGRKLAVEGDWSGAISGTSCVDCHATIGESFAEIGDDDADGYPNLSGYGSSAWLKSFLSNPGAGQHYGEKNQMPAYARRMTRVEMDLLVRWLTGDYVETNVEPYAVQRMPPVIR
jgi:mono/diheme cytochrome c family protein